MDLSKSIPTEVGLMGSNKIVEPNSDRDVLVAAIDQLFAEFELVYHNQFQKAFSNIEKLSYARRLWFTHLKGYSSEQILAAGRKATRESEYLPTVRGVLKYLESSSGLPDAYDAYREACLAPTPKAAHKWSHPAVYHAGVATEWYVLSTQPEKITRPIFERHYRALCERVAAGEQFSMPEIPSLPEPTAPPMTAEERQAAVRALREKVGL